MTNSNTAAAAVETVSEKANTAAAAAAETQQARSKLLIVGLGFAGMRVLNSFAEVSAEQATFDLIVVDPKRYFEFSPGLLPVLCRPEDKEHSQAKQDTPHGIFFEYASLFAKFCNVQFVNGVVKGVEENERIAHITHQDTQRREAIPFDFAVVSVGCAYGHYSQEIGVNPYFFCKPSVGLDETTKPCSQCTSLQSRLDQLADERGRLQRMNDSDSPGTVSVVGGGLVGIELAAEIAHYYPKIKLTLNLDFDGLVLPAANKFSQRYCKDFLLKHGVEIVTRKVGAPRVKYDIEYRCTGNAKIKATNTSSSTSRFEFLPKECRRNAIHTEPDQEWMMDRILVNSSLQVVSAEAETLTAADKVQMQKLSQRLDEVERQMKVESKRLAAIEKECGVEAAADLEEDKNSSSSSAHRYRFRPLADGGVFAIGDCVEMVIPKSSERNCSVATLEGRFQNGYNAETMADSVIAQLRQTATVHTKQQQQQQKEDEDEEAAPYFSVESLPPPTAPTEITTETAIATTTATATTDIEPGGGICKQIAKLNTLVTNNSNSTLALPLSVPLALLTGLLETAMGKGTDQKAEDHVHSSSGLVSNLLDYVKSDVSCVRSVVGTHMYPQLHQALKSAAIPLLVTGGDADAAGSAVRKPSAAVSNLSTHENLFSSSTVVSLGPYDGVAYAGDLVVAFGRPAAVMKEFIQFTKMQEVQYGGLTPASLGELKGVVLNSEVRAQMSCTASSLISKGVWALVPHF